MKTINERIAEVKTMKKDLSYYLGLPYTIELIPELQGGWFVGIKELPGCMTNAETPEEAVQEIHSLQSEWLQIALEEGLPIPEPKPEEEYSGNFRLRLPRAQHRKLAEEAEKQGVSLNTLCVSLLAEGLGQVVAQARHEAAAHMNTSTTVGAAGKTAAGEAIRSGA